MIQWRWINQATDRISVAGTAERAFLAAVRGVENDLSCAEPDLTIRHQTYIHYVKQRILSLPIGRFDEILSNVDGSNNTRLDAIFDLLTNLANCTRQGNNFCIDKAIDHSIESKILSSAVRMSPLRDQARVIFFNCISWISMLYPPVFQATEIQTRLAVDSTQCACIRDSQLVSNADRPICEVIQDFGPLLPVRRDSEAPFTGDSVFSTELLYVSLLNAKALDQVGGIEIVWVDHISSHLVFDLETLKLFMFRLPSFCDVNRYQNSAFAQWAQSEILRSTWLTQTSRIIDEYYDEFNKPRDFSSPAFLKEMRRSYGLIFSDDSRARAQYTRKEQKRARRDGLIDPYLDELCAGKASRQVALRTSYSKVTDFPILADRLSIIQEYIQRQSPKTLSMLWRDRRNLLQWSVNPQGSFLWHMILTVVGIHFGRSL